MPKRIPLRQCTGCREMKPKIELLRVVKSPEGEVSLDPKGKKPGRGAYVCPNAGCLKRSIKSRALERAFSVRVSEQLLEELHAETGEESHG